MDLKRNIAITMAGRLSGMAFRLLSSVILARGLGPDGRGLFALMFLVPELAITLGRLGFEQANAVYAGLDRAACRALLWHSVLLAFGVGAVTWVLGLGFLAIGAPGLTALTTIPYWLYALPLSLVPLKVLIDYWLALLRGMNQIVLLNVVETSVRVGSLLLTAVLVWGLGLHVIGALWADIILQAAAVVCVIALFRRIDVWGKAAIDRTLWKKAMRFALPAHAGTIAAYLNYRVDGFFIAAFLSREELGFYVIAAAVVERLWFLSGTVGTVLLPHLTNTPRRDPKLAAVVARHVAIWVGAGCLVVFAVADFFVELLYSSAFAPVVTPMRWLLPGIFTLSVGKVLVAEVLAREKPGYTVWASGVAAVVNIIGNFALVPSMGLAGAAIASSISYTILSGMLTWFYLRETGVSWTELIPRPSDCSLYVRLCSRSAWTVRLQKGTSRESAT